ncbi:MAG: transcription-repair coupling factor [Bacteroidales bacterium]|nr:transcription-repair coupling factor [Bacteroidales bacterium]
MQTNDLSNYILSKPRFNALKNLIENNTESIFLQGLKGSSAATFMAPLKKETSRNYIFVLNDAEEAGYFYHDLVQISGEENIYYFPSSYKRAIKYGQIDSASEILRTEVLSRLQSLNKGLMIVTYPEALAEKVIKSDTLSKQTLRIKSNEKVDSIFVADVLNEYGFERVEYVYEPGQYSVRGSILDVFSFSNEMPFRIDFFGDEVESIRTFEVDTQLSVEKINEISLVPNLSRGESFGISFLEFISSDVIFGFKDLSWLCERIESIANDEISEQLLISEEGDLDIKKKIVDPFEFKKRIFDFKRIEFGTKSSSLSPSSIEFHTSLQPTYHKNFELVAKSFYDYISNGYTIYILSDSQKQIERIQSIFNDRGDNISFTPVLKTVHEGFADDDMKACYFTDHQLFDRFHKYNLKSDKARTGKIALSLKELNQFKIGDYVVHIDHGVGKFGGLIRTPVNGKMQEVVKLIYQNDDILFVSIHALHKLAKYRGKEGTPPKINKLGTGAWEKMKEKTKSKMKDIARDLILLYAKRREEKGYSFNPDSYLQQELEASFIYEDTPDQLTSTQDVKKDMESERPMDRLICGDVGFGKTEIAVRAAFKAATDGKQVAVLVPTTVLAFQHYKTFTERLKDFPVRVDYLTRARKPSEVKQLLADLAEGKIDILVGTHKLIGKDVKFKDIGLLIIDEEQKFGVAVKEKLKQLKTNIDTLTMTATPIPRTLQFSLMGARDLSVIATPPPNRYPIQTEVHRFDEQVIKEAINFEMSRNGQVFFINNRIQQLADLESLIHRLIPDARVAVGHGQMDPEILEKRIIDFANQEYDVLLATTIIESGIDIPNANTMIINHAENFGLSELHQLRGRVGRSNKKAFCYLLAAPLNTLSQEGRRRLQAIENFSELGSGIHIAMQDLDIRGAGNLLGGEQSGFIADLGYETYQKILKEAVDELKNDEFYDLYENIDNENDKEDKTWLSDTIIESDLELLFPSDYIPNSSERISLYKELDNMEKEKDIRMFINRLQDRFGSIPKEGMELIRVVSLRKLGRELGFEKITLKQDKMYLYFIEDDKSSYYQSDAFGYVLNYMQHNPRQCQLRELKGKRSMLISDIKSVEEAVYVLNKMKPQLEIIKKQN